MRTNNSRQASNAHIKAVRSIGHELAEISVSIIETALRHVRNVESYQDAPDVACAVLVGRAGNDLNDYFRDYYRHNFDPPTELEDAQELTSILAIRVSNVVRKHTKLILQDIYADGLNDDEFEELLFAAIRAEVLEIVAENYGVEEHSPNVEF